MTSPAATTTIPVALDTGSRRRPYPYDMYINNVRVLLEPDKDGNVVSESTKTLEATAPLDYTYSSANPFKERTSEFQKLFAGFGQSIAPDGQIHRYHYAEKTDLSVDGLWMKGPAFEQHRETIAPGAGQVRQLIQALFTVSGAPQLHLFAICQNGVWRQAPGTTTWVQSLASGTAVLPAGHQPQQAVRFKHRGADSIDALYLACSGGNLRRLQSTSTTDAWELAPDAEGPPSYSTAVGSVGQARYIERVADELWVAGDYGVAKCEANPWVRANWSGTIEVGSTSPYSFIGDQHTKITWLRQLDDSLFIFKEDGVYSLDAEGLDHELFPTLRGKNNLVNGRNAAVWVDRMWFTYGNQTFTMSGGGQLKADGLEQMLENTSAVKGQWVAGSGHNTWFMYEVYYNQQTDTSHLIKHGSWIEEPDTSGTAGVAQFAEAHHGSVYDWDRRVTMCQVMSGLSYGATSFGNDRLYVGFLDGTIEWAILPQHSPNPSTDPHCEFTGLDSYVYLPQHHSQYRADNKVWHGMTVFGPRMDIENHVLIDYKTDLTDPGAAWYPVCATDPKYTLPGQRKDIVENEVTDPVYGRAVLLRVKLVRGAGDTFLHETPVIEGIAVHESIRPAFSREFDFSVRLGSFLPKRDGTVDRRRAYDVQQDILKACATVGPINVLLPTGETEEMVIVSYNDTKYSRQTTRDHTWSMQIHAIQLRTLTVGAPQHDAPIARGLTYATLEQYTLGQLESII